MLRRRNTIRTLLWWPEIVGGRDMNILTQSDIVRSTNCRSRSGAVCGREDWQCCRAGGCPDDPQPRSSSEGIPGEGVASRWRCAVQGKSIGGSRLKRVVHRAGLRNNVWIDSSHRKPVPEYR